MTASPRSEPEVGSYDYLPDDYDGPAPQHVIWCNSKWSHRLERHEHYGDNRRELVEEVRGCSEAARDEKAGAEVWPCSWYLLGRYDDGSTFEYPCGLPTRYAPDRGRGSYECLAGHDHVPADVRDAQGWDYAGDEGEARLLARAGTVPVQMDGSPWPW